MNDLEKITIEKMITIYCSGNRHINKKGLCDKCMQILEYAHNRLEKCKFGNQKPTCEKCFVHCYPASMQIEIQKIMRYAGPRMIYKHPILAIKHVLKNRR